MTILGFGACESTRLRLPVHRLGFLCWVVIALLLGLKPAPAEELTLDTNQSLATLERTLSEHESDRGVDTLARGAVSFLRAIEVTLQERYRTDAGIDDEMGMVPILRLPLPPNPQPDPFEPTVVAKIFAGVDADMERTRAILSEATLGSDDKLVVDVAALWFDVDGNGTRGVGEGVLEILGVALGGPMAGSQSGVAPPDTLIVHFDAADAKWLAAYTHLLSAVSEVVLAFDPTDVIAEILTSNAAMADIQGEVPPAHYSVMAEMDGFVDTFATVYGALNRVPDKERITAARDHLLEMVDRNRAFWTLVGQETDDSAEWIPNAAQDAELGFDLPAETGSVWLSVLSDAEAVLKGELLVPHWRTEPGGRVNVAALVADPPAFDIVTWFHGAGLVPYMEKGPLVTWESYARFSRLFMGNDMLFAVLLN